MRVGRGIHFNFEKETILLTPEDYQWLIESAEGHCNTLHEHGAYPELRTHLTNIICRLNVENGTTQASNPVCETKQPELCNMTNQLASICQCVWCNLSRQAEMMKKEQKNSLQSKSQTS